MYLETYELSFRLQLVKALVSDMKARSKALVDVTSRINALEAMVSSVAVMSDDLYKTTGLLLYPPPGSLA